MDLLAELERCEGNATAKLEEIAGRVAPSEQTVEELLKLAESDSPALQKYATWILKKLVERGAPISESVSDDLLSLLRQSSGWETRIHVLQIIPHMEFPEAPALEWRDALVDSSKDTNTFVRAWSFGALLHLADQHPGFRPQVCRLIGAARESESASVQARIRKAKKGLDWID
jgi:hypothetical protein